MAIRQLIASKDTHICHVNTDDNSPTYEAATEYARGTVVQYQGVAYAAIDDISAEDTDTPDEAPLKWAIVPDAAGLAADGELSNLESRVTALEDFDDSIPEGYLYMGSDNFSDVIENGTYSECLDTLAAHLATFVQTLEDDELIMVDEIVIVGNASLMVRQNKFTNADTTTNLVGSVVSSSDAMFIFWNAILYSGSGTSTIQHLQYTVSSGNWTFNDDGPTSSGASRTVTCKYKKFKKIKTSS